METYEKWGETKGVKVLFVAQDRTKIIETNTTPILLSRINQDPLTRNEFKQASIVYTHLLKITGICIERRFMKEARITIGDSRSMQLRFDDVSKTDTTNISTVIGVKLQELNLENPAELGFKEIAEIGRRLIEDLNMKCSLVFARYNFGVEIVNVSAHDLNNITHELEEVRVKLELDSIAELSSDIILASVHIQTNHDGKQSYILGFNTITTHGPLLIKIQNWRVLNQFCHNLNKAVKPVINTTRSLDTTNIILRNFGLQSLRLTEYDLKKVIYLIKDIEVIRGKLLL